MKTISNLTTSIVPPEFLAAIEYTQQPHYHAVNVELATVSGFQYYWSLVLRENALHVDAEWATERFARFIARLYTTIPQAKKLSEDETFALLTRGIINRRETEAMFLENIPSGKKFCIEVKVLGARFTLQRMGKGFGMRISGMRNDDMHEAVCSILHQWSIDPQHTVREIDSVISIITTSSIEVNEHFDVKGNTSSISLYELIDAMKHTMPLISFENTSILARRLVEQWQSGIQNSTVSGYYLGLPIEAKLLWGTKEQMRSSAWRIGSLKNYNHATGCIEFHDDNNSDLHSGMRPRLLFTFNVSGFDTYGAYCDDNNIHYEAYQHRLYAACTYIIECLRLYDEHARDRFTHYTSIDTTTPLGFGKQEDAKEVPLVLPLEPTQL